MRCAYFDRSKCDRRYSKNAPLARVRNATLLEMTMRGTPWIAFGEAPELTAVDAQDRDLDSMLTFYRRLLAFRRGHARDANLTDQDQVAALTGGALGSAQLVFGEGELRGDTIRLPGASAAIFELR